MTTASEPTAVDATAIFGNKRVEFGTWTAVSGDDTMTITTEFINVQAVIFGGTMLAYTWTQSSGTITVSFTDPAAGAGGDYLIIGY